MLKKRLAFGRPGEAEAPARPPARRIRGALRPARVEPTVKLDPAGTQNRKTDPPTRTRGTGTHGSRRACHLSCAPAAGPLLDGGCHGGHDALPARKLAAGRVSRRRIASSRTPIPSCSTPCQKHMHGTVRSPGFAGRQRWCPDRFGLRGPDAFQPGRCCRKTAGKLLVRSIRRQAALTRSISFTIRRMRPWQLNCIWEDLRASGQFEYVEKDFIFQNQFVHSVRAPPITRTNSRHGRVHGTVPLVDTTAHACHADDIHAQ